ncbi:protein mono-ADP-ribosyltransferase PARP16-like [Physella acuta]|uniref:protein mono-ADP-ribosyltransferase PARP16-like n=1 Tax=Physella acuta TaxID=109671 RepID=UPI0027DB5822|nr:protein mono-ADP-ribosyltransferase PARP16-like [Physella acuta]XP_059165658.1 protein mono-ADP-ribosyltransferase PARP16-like [Physella acuta]
MTGNTEDIKSENELLVATQLQNEILGCDMLWSLFVAAARSYRFTSILHPFPPMYSTNNEEEKNMFGLKDAISRVPALSPNSEFLLNMDKDSQKLLSWVLQTKHFKLKLCDKENGFKTIKELTGQVMDTSEPNYIFEVIPSEERDNKFKLLQGSSKTFYAYHGSRLDNFYSILHNGLNAHLNKVSVFGEGTYLSSELSVSLIYSPTGEGWRSSALGVKLSCVAVCQMIDHPSVKCQIKEGTATQQKQRARASRITDDVPEKYYVVQNNDVIRVKYLLVYRENVAPAVSTNMSSSHSWLREYRFPLLMFAYFMLLAAIGLANSRQAVNALTRLYKTLKFT